VLVVDDHLEHRRVLAGMLEPLGFHVEQAASGQEAIRQAALLSPDLILMDLSMPQMDGFETSRLIRRNALCQAPIIVISANAFADDRERSIAAYCNDYLAKPVHIPALLERIQQQLELQWLHRAAEPEAPQPQVEALPSASELAELRELAALGYMRGIQDKLDAIERQTPACAPFTKRLRALAKGFRLDELNRQFKEAEHECSHAAC
jgi:CheY-like chemotaxis protein